MFKFIKILLLSLFIWNLHAGGSIMLVGGGREDYGDWSDDPYGWFVQQADSGKIINIDVDEASSWYPDYFIFLGAASSSHKLQIDSKTLAMDSTTYKELISAKAVFIEGGDQWDYVKTWKGTLVEDAIHYVFYQGGAIGGSSAGLAVLGEVVFDAKFNSAYPEDVTYNPYDNRVSFTDDFLKILPGVFTDSHFHTRARMGRLVPMLARRIQDYGEDDIMGIGVDDKTALCIGSDMKGKTYGLGTVTILYQSQNSAISCTPGNPLTFTDINYHQLIHGAIFDLNSRTLDHPGEYLTQLGNPPANPGYKDTTLVGWDEESADVGEIVITNLTTGKLNAWDGLLNVQQGSATIPQTVIIPKIWNDIDYSENRLVAGMYGIAEYPHFVAIYLDDSSTAEVDSRGLLQIQNLCYVLDGYDCTHTGFVQFKETNYPGIIGAKLHFFGGGQVYDLMDHSAMVGGIDVPDKYLLPDKINLGNNFPNPFNPVTTFRYWLPEKMTVRLAVYDVQGELIETLFRGTQTAGHYQLVWNAQRFPSGIYFYRLSAEFQTKTGKCILQK